MRQALARATVAQHLERARIGVGHDVAVRARIGTREQVAQQAPSAAIASAAATQCSVACTLRHPVVHCRRALGSKGGGNSTTSPATFFTADRQ
jgi:hypothetical protein